MPKIRCHYLDCLFLDERYCSAAAIEINPDAGCLTYKPNEEAQLAGWDDDAESDVNAFAWRARIRPSSSAR